MPPWASPRRLALAVFAVAALLCSSAWAEPAAVRLRWRSSTDLSVAGYHVYVRSLDGTYDAPRDAGLPPALPDGTVSVVVGGLNPRTAYAFALSAYSAAGGESGLSNELTLTARRLRCAQDADCIDSDACTDNERCEAGRCVHDAHVCPGNGCNEGICDAIAGCLVHEMPDGSACTNGDPCVPGACAGGTCVVSPQEEALASGHDLVASQFVLHHRRRAAALSALGVFAAASFDPLATGVTVQVVNGDGLVLFQADVPTEALHRRGRRAASFRYRPRGPSSAVAGLRRLSLDWDGAVVTVALRAVLPAAASPADARVTWAVHAAGMCVRASGLVCEASGSRSESCQ